MMLELTAALMAVEVFAPQIAGTRVIIYCDNTGAGALMDKWRSHHGDCRSMHCRGMLRRLARRCIGLGVELDVRRVSTSSN